MASIHPYRTAKGERRYEVRYRDGDGRQRSQRLLGPQGRAGVQGRRRAPAAGRNALPGAQPERFGDSRMRGSSVMSAGAAGACGRGPRRSRSSRESLATLAPLADLPVDRIHRAARRRPDRGARRRAPRRAEMSLALLKRILRAAEERGQLVDPRSSPSASPEPRRARAALPDLGGGRRASLVDARVRVPAIVPIAILTMLRRGEIIGLRDRRRRFRLAARSRSSARHRTASATRTKTRAGRRTVDVGPQTLRLIREQQLARAPNEDGLLFPSRSGTPWTRTTSWAATSSRPPARPASPS